MKRIFTSILLFLACFSAKGQLPNTDVFDFDSADTFYRYDWAGTRFSELINNQLYIDTVNYKRNQWRIGKPNKKVFSSALTLPNAIVTDTVFSCLPNDTSVFFLKLPDPAPLFSLSYLSFAYRLDIDTGDIALLEASIDSCKTWTNILTGTDSNWYLLSVPDMSVSTAGWKKFEVYIYPLKSVSNGTVYFKFTFITNNNTTTRDGWVIDHITDSHRVEDVPIIANHNAYQLYPNPATGKAILKFDHTTNAACQVTVVDALGKQVYTDRIRKGSSEYSLAVGGWAKGVYFIEIDDEHGNKSAQKLMVE